MGRDGDRDGDRDGIGAGRWGAEDSNAHVRNLSAC